MKKKYAVDRLIALCYDYIFLMIVVIGVSLGFNLLNKNMFHIDNILFMIIIVNILIYMLIFPIIFLKLRGSVGKYLNDLYIEPTQGKITFGRILFREIFMKQIFYLTGVGIIVEIIFFIIKKETLHDYYLKTVVRKKEMPVKEKKTIKEKKKN